MKTPQWFAINESARTFDLVLFKSKGVSGRLLSAAQAFFTGKGGFTHSAVVVKGLDLPMWSPYYDPKLNYVFESTTLGRLVRMTPVETIMDFYDGAGLALCRLHEKYRPESLSRDRLGEIVHSMEHGRFDMNPLRLVPALHKDLRALRPAATGTSYFCSQFVAQFYKSVGVLSESVNPLNALPVDFAYGDLDNEIPHDLFDSVVEYAL